MTYLDALTLALAAAGGLRGFSSWVLPNGAGFGDTVNWWNGGDRHRPHEGIDLFRWLDTDGDTREFGAGSPAVCPLAGTVIGVCRDFLGESVFIASREPAVVQVFGHLRPAGGVRPGARVGANAIVGAVARGRGRGAPPHLHVSLATGTALAPCWDDLGGLTLLDPSGYRLRS